MDQTNLYSVRMRASAGGKHISGAERLVPHDKITVAVHELMTRAEEKIRKPDDIVLHIESLGNRPPKEVIALDLVTVNASDVISGRGMASRVLQTAGVSEKAAELALRHLSEGAAPSGGNMRGAIIMDSRSGERLEPDQERGIRAARFDWSEDAAREIAESLTAIGLTHYRTAEALALATKVSHGPGVAAELCWSDEPDYTAGYVASRQTGYVRFPLLKHKGETHGGRVFFVDRNELNLNRLIDYLQTEVVLINAVGTCGTALEPEEYFGTRGESCLNMNCQR